MTYGSLAGDIKEIQKTTADIQTLSDWERVWTALGNTAEKKCKYLHAAYCFRMVEFFLKEADNKKEFFYEKCIVNFYKAFDTELHITYEKYSIPFESKFLHCIKIPASSSKGTVIICGGYDSFIEEFVLQVYDLVQRNYDVLLFEGAGQGNCLRQKMFFRYDFEKTTSAVLDYFKIKECAMVGISWGGYFALRSAAFEKRIKAVVAYDVMDNGFEVMTNIFPPIICNIIQFAYYHKRKKIVNGLVKKLCKRSVLADWAISQGMYITGTETPYDLYESFSQHTLIGIGERITQDTLLLAGEHDHYIPLNQFYRTKENLTNANSLTCRLFTKNEGGEQHCQVGNHLLAVNYIIDWLDRHFATK